MQVPLKKEPSSPPVAPPSKESGAFSLVRVEPKKTAPKPPSNTAATKKVAPNKVTAKVAAKSETACRLR